MKKIVSYLDGVSHASSLLRMPREKYLAGKNNEFELYGRLMEIKFMDGVSRTFFLLAFSMTRHKVKTVT